MSDDMAAHPMLPIGEHQSITAPMRRPWPTKSTSSWLVREEGRFGYFADDYDFRASRLISRPNAQVRWGTRTTTTSTTNGRAATSKHADSETYLPPNGWTCSQLNTSAQGPHDGAHHGRLDIGSTSDVAQRSGIASTSPLLRRTSSVTTHGCRRVAVRAMPTGHHGHVAANDDSVQSRSA